MSSGGFSEARLGRMRDVMAGHVKHGDVPGIVTLVSRRDEVHVAVIGTKASGASSPSPPACPGSTTPPPAPGWHAAPPPSWT
jgi:hypothetical protein